MTWCRSAAYMVQRVQCTRTYTHRQSVYVCMWACVVHREQLRLSLLCCQRGVVCCGCLSITLQSIFLYCFECLSCTLCACQAFSADTTQENIKNLIQTCKCGHVKPASPPAGISLQVLFWDVAMETGLCEDVEIIVWILFAESAEFYLVRFTFQPVLISLQQFCVKAGRTKLPHLSCPCGTVRLGLTESRKRAFE